MNLTRKHIHYAWIICIGCALMIFSTSGLTVNAFTVYQPHILKNNNFTNSQLSLIITFRNMSAFVCMVLSGWYFKVFGLRRGMTIAGIITAFAFFLFAASDKLFIYLIGSCFMGIGYSLGGMIPLTIMICNWFSESRNTALGICYSGTGLATIGIPSLINNTVNKLGLSMTFILQGVVIFILIMISFLLIRDCPEDKKMTPYGIQKEEETKPVYTKGLERKDWIFIVPMLIMLGPALNVSYSCISVLITGEGYSVDAAAIAISVSGISIIVGKLVTGKLGDKIGNFKCNYISCGSLLIGLIMCCLIKLSSTVLYSGIAVYSIGIGAVSLCIAKWAADLATTKDRDKVIRRFQMIYSMGSMLFSPIPGMIADNNNGSYVKAFIMFTVFSAVIFIIIQAIYITIDRRRKFNELR